MNPNVQQPDPLVGELRKDIQQILKQRIDEEVRNEKQRQYLRLDKADNYYRGNTYLAADYDPSSETFGWSSVGTPRAGSQQDSSSLLDYNIDITKSYGRKFFSVLGTRPFHNAKALPDDPQREEDRKAARQYELSAIYLKTKWNARVMNIMVFYHQWKSGNVYAYIDHVADKAVWGETSVPEYTTQTETLEPAGYRCTSCGQKSPEPQITEDIDPVTQQPVPQTVCPSCGAPISDIHFEEAQTTEVPVQTGEKKYPNAGPKLHLLTGYQVTTPFDTKSLDTAPWLRYEYEEHPGALLQLYREQLKDKLDDKGEIKSDTDGDLTEQGRRSRQMAASIGGMRDGEERKKRWTYTRDWLMPFMYEYVQDEATRAKLYENYPDGLKVTRVEGCIVKQENEAITDSWAVFEPEPGDYLYKDPMCWGILGHQDVINDGWNMMIQILERVMPSLIADPDVIDINKLREGNHLCEILPAKPGTSGRMESAFAKVPTASFPDHAFPMMGALEQNVQSHTGLLPPVFGGGEKSATAEEARTRLNQALMQLGVPGEFAGLGWKNVLDIAVRKIKKYGLKVGAIPVSGGDSELFDQDALLGGNAHFENEPGVPMSWAERRDQMNLVIGQNPALASALGLDAPMNIPVVRDFLLPGMEELQIPGENRRQKIVEVIRELLQQQPLGDQPSILPEPGVDDPADAALVLEWLRSDAGRKSAKQNPAGRQNVVAYGMAMAMLPPPMGAPPPMMPPPEDGKEPKPMGPPPGGHGESSALPPPM